MIPKEKAKKLIDIFGKELAIKCVDEILKESSINITTIRYKGCTLTDKEYWQEVKQEIEKL